MPLEKPIKESGHIRILYGNIASHGSVAKITGKEGFIFEGVARVFDCEDDANDAISAGKIKKGDVIVIRYETKRWSRYARNVKTNISYNGCWSWK